jgi:hypothetical protein
VNYFGINGASEVSIVAVDSVVAVAMMAAEVVLEPVPLQKIMKGIH